MAQPDLFRLSLRPWNAGRLVGPKPPLKPKHIWAIRQQLKNGHRLRDLALFNCAIDAKLRGCDLVKLRVSDVARRAHDDLIVLKASPQQLDDVGEAEAPPTQHERLIARLAFLSPDLQRRLLEGDLPAGLTLRRFSDSSVPLAWADQDAWIANFG